MKIFLLTICMSFLLLISCSENQVTPPPSALLMSDYFPSTPGSWWLYQNYTVDSLGIKTKTWTDSVFVIEPKIIDGKQAIAMVSVAFIDNEFYIDTNYYYVEGSKLYGYMDSPQNEGQFEWKLYFDLEAANWLVIRNEYHADSMLYDPYSGDSSRNKNDIIFEIQGSHAVNNLFKFKENTYTTKGFKLSMTYSSYLLEYGKERSDILEQNAYFWFVKNIGEVNLFIEDVDNKNHNVEKVLIDYDIKE